MIEKRIEDYVLGNASGGNAKAKGDAFTRWILEFMFQKSDYELQNKDDLETGYLYVDGKNDGGVDSAFLQNGTMNIIQGKYKSSCSIKDIEAWNTEMSNLFKDGPTSFQKEELYYILNAIKEKDKVHTLNMFFVSSGKFNDNDLEKVKSIKKRMDENLSKCKLLNDINLEIEILDIDGIETYIYSLNGVLPNKYKGRKEKLLLEKYFVNKQNDTIVAEVNIKELARFVENAQEYLYYSNVRNYLGNNKVNRRIKETFMNSPTDFWLFNNGITIVCDSFNCKSLGDGANCFISTPQIVNGCQTSKSICDCWIKGGKSNEQQGTILVKIIKDTNNKRREITRHTNSQTAVSGKDFYALEDFHNKLKSSFKQLGYNYEIQKNAVEKNVNYKGNSKYDYLFDNKFKSSGYKINAKDCTQAYVAGILGKPATAKNAGSIAPGGQEYANVFNDDTTDDPRAFLFPYAIQYYALKKYKKEADKKLILFAFNTMYFKVLLKFIKDCEKVGKEISNIPINDSTVVNFIDTIFSDSAINLRLLKITDEVFTRFSEDSGIVSLIGSNLPKFAKATIESEKVMSIIDGYISRQYTKIIKKEDIKIYTKK